jgi:hypothetical protein
MIRFNTPNGRLKYSSKSEAEKTARKLGLDGVHSHMMNGERIYMPGENHKNLNDALRERGREPTMVPGQGGGMMGGMMGGGMMGSSNSTTDMGMMDMSLSQPPDRPNDPEMPKLMPDPDNSNTPDDSGDGFLDGAFSDGFGDAEGGIRNEPVPEPFDSQIGAGDPDDDDDMEIY